MLRYCPQLDSAGAQRLLAETEVSGYIPCRREHQGIAVTASTVHYVDASLFWHMLHDFEGRGDFQN